MAIVASGQITIVDMYDKPPVQMRLTSNLPKIISKSSDGTAQLPDWTQTNLNVRAELYVGGNASNLITVGDSAVSYIRWYYNDGAGDVELTADGNGFTLSKEDQAKVNNKLTVNQNKVTSSKPSLMFTALVGYIYPGTTTVVPVSATIDFSLAQNGEKGVPGADGASAYSTYLTNTSHVFPVDNNSITTTELVTTTKAVVYKGLSTVAVTGDDQPTHIPTGFVVTKTATDTWQIKVPRGTDLSALESGDMEFGYTADGKYFVSLFSWSIAKNGKNGDSSTSFWMMADTDVVLKKWNGSSWVYEPSSITFSAKYQTGANTPANYSGRFRLTGFNGDTSLGVQDSATNEVSKTFTLNNNTNYTSIDARLFLAGGFTNLLDEINIRVVAEPRKLGTVSIYAESDTIRNHAGSAKINAKAYFNGVDVTASTVFQWEQEGVGIVGNSSSQLTVTSAMVDYSELFMCRATIDGTVYTDTIIIYDVTDPVAVDIQALNGTVFKNGEGTSSLNVLLWRNDSIIDANGTQFGYWWRKYRQNGVEDTSWKPTPATTPTLATAGPTIAKLTTTNTASNLTLDDVTYLRAGIQIFLGASTTVYTVSTVNTSTKIITVTPAITGSIAANTTVRIANYKNIRILNTELLDDKEQIVCAVIE